MVMIKTGSGGKIQSVQTPKSGTEKVASKEDLKDVTQKKTEQNQAPKK